MGLALRHAGGAMAGCGQREFHSATFNEAPSVGLRLAMVEIAARTGQSLFRVLVSRSICQDREVVRLAQFSGLTQMLRKRISVTGASLKPLWSWRSSGPGSHMPFL